jgi:hypothetical protein
MMFGKKSHFTTANIIKSLKAISNQRVLPTLMLTKPS